MKTYFLLGILIFILPTTHASPKRPTLSSPKPNSIIKIGDHLPTFSLCNENGKLVTEKDLSRKIIVMNFIFTRCGEPTMCPSATKKMIELQKLVRNHSLDKDVNFITISFDPKFDTPTILKQYASAYKVDPSNYSFLTGDEQTINNLTQQFGVYTVSNQGTINHSMKTVVIDKSGTIVYQTPQKNWQPKALLKKIKNFL